MKKKNNTKNNIAIRSMIFIMTLALVLIFVYIIFPSPSSPISNNTQQTKQFESKDLKFAISFPADFLIEEKFNSLILVSPKETIINVRRIGTNFDTIDSYLDNLVIKNNLKLNDRKSVKINNYDGIKTELDDPNSENKIQQIYFIYADNWVYSLSTSSDDLFSDLDQIAQSFRYNP